MNRKLKIIYYSPHPTHDIVSEVGYSTHQRETIEAMRNLGHEVLPVIMGGTIKHEVQQYHESLSIKSSFKYRIFKMLPLIVRNTLKDLLLMRHDKRARVILGEKIREFVPDLIYERNEYFQDKGLLLAKKMGIRHFLEVNSPCVSEMRSFEGPSLLHFMGLKKEKRKMRSSSHIFAVSSALKRHLINEYQPSAPIDVIPNAINPNKETSLAENTVDIRKIHNIEKKQIIGFVGSIFPHHGVDKLIKAFQSISVKHPNAFLLIVGDGALRRDFEELATKLLAKNTFLFTGKIPHHEVINYIMAFDIAVMPDSNWYGSPIKIFEYGIMKIPMIVPDEVPLHDVMINGIDGCIVKSNVKEIAFALEKMLAEPEKFKQMGVNFYNKILEHYTWEKQVEKTLSYF